MEARSAGRTASLRVVEREMRDTSIDEATNLRVDRRELARARMGVAVRMR